jgi:predicted nuclease with RNAse H fold
VGDQESDSEREQRLRHEAIVGAVEDGDVTYFDSPLSQYRRREQREREQDGAERKTE